MSLNTFIEKYKLLNDKDIKLVAVILYKQRNPTKRLTGSRIKKVIRQYKKRKFTQGISERSLDVIRYINRRMF